MYNGRFFKNFNVFEKNFTKLYKSAEKEKMIIFKSALKGVKVSLCKEWKIIKLCSVSPVCKKILKFSAGSKNVFLFI